MNIFWLTEQKENAFSISQAMQDKTLSFIVLDLEHHMEVADLSLISFSRSLLKSNW